MSIIGTTLQPRRKGDTVHRVVGAAGGGYVIEPVETFGAPVQVGVGELVDRFKVGEVAAPDADPRDAEQRGWDALATRATNAARATLAGRHPDTFAVNRGGRGELSEDVFAVASGQDTDGTRAQRLAREILAGPKAAEARRGSLTLHPDVRRAVDALIAEEGR